MDPAAPPASRASNADGAFPWRATIAIYLGIALLAVVDIASDLEGGVPSKHAWIEMTMFALAGAGLGLGLRSRWRVARALRTSLAASQTEAAAWRDEAHGLVAGVASAIDEQLDRWSLSAAEKETALLLLKGLSHKEIADLRGVSEATARQQARALYKKSGLTGRHDLAAFFLEDLLQPTQRGLHVGEAPRDAPAEASNFT